MLGPAIHAHLIANVTIFGLVGTRIYPVFAPQNPTYGFITYQLISEPRWHTLDGYAAPNAMIQFDSWSKTYLQSSQIADSLTTVFDGFKGLLGGLVSVNSMLQKNRIENFDATDNIGDYRTLQEFSVWYN